MKLYVKPGRRYYFEGKEYAPGQAIDGIPDKFVALLTHQKGPLQKQPSSSQTDLPATTALPAGEDLAALREEYRGVVGKGPFHGWDAAQLREKIATYRTTNMGDSALTTHLTAED